MDGLLEKEFTPLISPYKQLLDHDGDAIIFVSGDNSKDPFGSLILDRIRYVSRDKFAANPAGQPAHAAYAYHHYKGFNTCCFISSTDFSYEATIRAMEKFDWAYDLTIDFIEFL